MKTADWYFDFVSPFSYLQLESFHRLPKDLQVRCKPILFAGLLDAYGHKGPAEIPPKRRFTYRHVQWIAQHHGIPLRFPPAHPFNPIKVLRLAVALNNDMEKIRTIFRFIWREGRTVDDPGEWRRLLEALEAPNADECVAAPQVKEALKKNGEEALAAGVFGVPSFVVGGEVFWGFDATDMLLEYLANPALLGSDEMRRVSDLPAAIQRKV
ncbi:MAG: 2-hydroxychromene-2-carboxylate isomerase [Betaproteobacteria bacterium]|nr:2-hydroxychromene-2-carboxylate isomerase [Betaproteobacteria bacterium]